jgi:glucan 1,3-beta-glucosidase
MPVSGSLLHLKEIPQLKGVNLGGLFVPEVWMNPSFFNGTVDRHGNMHDQPLNEQGQPLGWGGSLCRMVDWNREETERRMSDRFNSWFTEKDFAEIAQAGFNSLRVPLGYWNVIDDPHHAYAPADVSKSRDKIDWIFEMADKYDLLVLLDMHGGPGSQNGIDHSGCSKAAEWDHPDNQVLSRQAVRAMAERYGQHPNLWGIELLNEPSDFYSANDHELLASFYRDSYHIIRAHSPDCVVVFNELYPAYYSWWSHEMREPLYHNVVMDMHLYDWQEPYTEEWNIQHVLDARSWAATIADYADKYPILVGEWCMSTGIYTQAGQSFVDAAVASFAQTAGWFLWTWKVERGERSAFGEWDVQYQQELLKRTDGAEGLDTLSKPSLWLV